MQGLYYIIPSSTHTLNFSGPPKKALQSLDKATRRYICRWLRLPRDTSLGVFHASTDTGGLAIPVLALTTLKKNRANHLRDYPSHL